MINDEQLSQLFQQAIDQLADDDIRKGGEALQFIAKVFHKGGMPIESFFNIRKHIVDEAIKKTDALFIHEKIKLIERDMQYERHSTRPSAIITH